jgi:5-(carboxyamino)imidazole ribonucleotide synthase
MSTPFPLPPLSRIGIVGGGQLGRMSAMAAARLGYLCHIFTPEEEAPAAQVAARTFRAAYDDLAALEAFAESCDVITFEFENVSAEGLARLARRRPVRPSPFVLEISQDRLAEKRFVSERAGARTAPFAPVGTHEELDFAIEQIGLPAILKTTRLGYDGKGQARVSTRAEAEAAFARLAPAPFILEGVVDFAAELSVVLARGADGTVAAFDPVLNHHHDHILDLTLAPAPLPEKVADEARAVARRIAEALDLVGLLAVEMFLDREGRILVNELAPRPHNSGHWTLDACPVSQFELHIRAIAGLPLPEPRRHSDAVMKNLIGPEEMALWPEILATPGLIPHHYGKREARPGRKMGHVTRLFPKGGLPGLEGIRAALAPLAMRYRPGGS